MDGRCTIGFIEKDIDEQKLEVKKTQLASFDLKSGKKTTQLISEGNTLAVISGKKIFTSSNGKMKFGAASFEKGDAAVEIDSSSIAV